MLVAKSGQESKRGGAGLGARLTGQPSKEAPEIDGNGGGKLL
jgi:hypothetical protein